MDKRVQTMAEATARLLLQRFQEDHPEWTAAKTPLDELVSWLGLDVATFYPDDYPAGTYGFMDPDEDESLIWLRRDLSETLRRFTLAHELGHAVLHCRASERIQTVLGDLTTLLVIQDEQQETPELSRADPCHDSDVQEDMAADRDADQEALGIGETYDPRSQRELAANIFAAELLMPLEQVRRLYLVQRIAARELAGVFAVSNAAILNRLAGLLRPSQMEMAVQSVHDEALQEPKKQAEAPSKKHYDEFQRAAIEAPTPALVIAGPGSGKTSTLIGRVEYIIRTLGIPPHAILALTFSRKAAQEMEERLRQSLGEAAAPLPRVSTFHAFCADLLRQYSTLVGLRADFSLIDEAEAYALLRQQANEIRLHHYQKLQAPAYYFPDMLKAISRAKDELVSPEIYALLAQQMREQARDEDAMQKAEKALEVAHVYALYQNALARRGDTDFGGLLSLVVQLFSEHPEVLREQQQRYQHILVDEFQDVNRASGVLLRLLAGENRQVWVVGDANQAIYSFRGASPANISQFETDFPGAVVLPLSHNYRSRPDLVAIAESFRCIQLELGQEPGKNQPVRLTQPDAYVTLAKASDEASELAGLIEDIGYRHASGYAYRDMAVLCRTRALAKKISRALAAAHLPVIERGGMLEQEHIKDVLSIVLLLTEMSGMGLLRAGRQREHSLTQSDIEALLLSAREQKSSPGMLIFSAEAPPDMSMEGRCSLNRLAEIMQTLQHAPDVWSLLAQYLFIETSLVRDQLVGESAQAQRQNAILADYDRLLQMARHYDQQVQRQHGQTGSNRDENTVHASEQLTLEERAKGFLEYLSLLVLLRQDGANRQGTDENAGENSDIIRVMTVHASKGLEFPVVYIPGLVQRRFPAQARSSPVTAPEGMLAPESVGSAAHESGESCLFYVGVTRARDHLVLSYSERYGKLKYKRSLYLDALEAGLPAERITKLHWNTAGTAKDDTAMPQVVQTAPFSESFLNAMKAAELSASAIEAYQRCPRQYAYSNIYHFTSEADGYQLFWQATQQTVELLRKQMQDAGDEQRHFPTQEEIEGLYTQRWQALGGHTAPFAPMYEEHGHEIVEAIRRQLARQESAWSMHPGFDVDVAGKTVRVTVDRVETSAQAGTPVKFVRTRFGRRKDKPPAEIRELLYTLAYRQQYPGQQIELHSHNMSTGETLPITMTTRKEQSLYDEVEQSIKGLERNEYPAQPAEAFRCPTCPFFLVCPA